jgi:hypothetical protein
MKKALHRSIRYDFPNDQADATHPNIHGAEKLSAFIGTLLAGPIDKGGINHAL